MNDLISSLNTQQRDAVTAGAGPTLVLAGPGSGKTRVLTHRIAYLVEVAAVKPYHIMAVTFTNKAAAEMRRRVEDLLGGKLDGLLIGTFHAICARLLRREADQTPFGNDFVIYDTDDQLSVVRQVMGEFNISDKKFNPYRILNAISTAKNELIAPQRYVTVDYFTEMVGRIYPRYQEILGNNNAMDFDDLLMKMAALLSDNPTVRDKYQERYSHVLVDEFQDTNTAQYKLVRELAAPQDNIFVVGDEDQSIYAFRGADYRNVNNFRTDYPQAKIVLLEQNYRSTQMVLDVARAVIKPNPHRIDKKLFTDRSGGAPITVHEAFDETDEGEFVVRKIADLQHDHGHEFREIAVMYRVNAQSRALEDAFRNSGLPYRLVGGVSFYQRREIRDLLAYLRVLNNPNDTISFGRIINVPKRGIGKKSVETFAQWAENTGGYAAALETITNGGASPLSGRAAKSMMQFGQMLAKWQLLLGDGDLLAVFDELVADIKYNIYLHEISESDEQITERRENVAELRNIIEQRKDETLADFLGDISLASEIDRLDDRADAVTLMTLHAAKGLEYPVVFITGLEEKLLPHSRSIDNPEEVAEERRLLYVGVTRAEQQLYLTHAFRRSLYGGGGEPRTPSRFLGDIPLDLMQGNTSSGATSTESAFRRQTRWEPSPTSTPRTGKKRAKIIPFSDAYQPKYKVGTRVFHGKFGAGVVIDNERHGDDEDVTVAFEGIGIKKLAASFANLTVLKD